MMLKLTLLTAFSLLLVSAGCTADNEGFVEPGETGSSGDTGGKQDSGSESVEGGTGGEGDPETGIGADELSEEELATAHCIEDAEEPCDGLDNNCNGYVDEGCTCQVQQQGCYTGPPSTIDVGICRRGLQTCAGEFYGECEDEILPGFEACDGIDNDCDGDVDETPECQGRVPSIQCPADIMASTLSTQDIVVQASDPDGDPLTYTWEIVDKPFGSSSVVTGGSNGRGQLFLDLAGTYIVPVTVTDPQGNSSSCTVNVESIPSEDLRIELVWNVGDTSDLSDVDLHLLNLNAGSQWFTGADCYYANCTGGGLSWDTPGRHDDPRLDIDDVDGNGPENINVDAPQEQTYRVGLHYYDSDNRPESTVVVKIYCGGDVVREFEPVQMRATGNNTGDNDFWVVADVTWNGSTCEVSEFGEAGNRQIVSRNAL